MNFRLLGIAAGCMLAISAMNVQAAGTPGAVDVQYLGEDVGGNPLFGQGINYHVKFIADAAGTASIYTGESIGIGTIAAIKSKSWNDNQSDINQDAEKNPLGWAHTSKWAMVDLSALKGKGFTSANVVIRLQPYNDKVVNETDSSGKPLDDDHAVPAITVWQGIDQSTTTGSPHWYPNNFQATEGAWWASFAAKGLLAVSSTPNNPIVSFNKTIKLDGINDYLTVAIAGNNTTQTAGHNDNFKLTVSVTPK